MPLDIGSEVEGKVTGIANFGAFIELPEKHVGLVHISQVSDNYVTNINEHLKVGDLVKVKIMGMAKGDKYDLSIKQVGKEGQSQPIPMMRPRRNDRAERPAFGTFEDKINQFLKQSDERLLDLKKNIEGKQGIRKRKKKIKE
ncbi:hypothetical protein A2276_01695 [candidate division WOR-1 bacterium RIFOXYA12_FULL_43_27]|uniref:S1 motif domain-containing protein n=1 Tax=candidate division WOR-1 bacterium RIFOXYC2_FULL_46_14 TaxID=1802587 RepID=A0A1F4U6W7_UNCSA|nr:MAG: hypothetical protein A2276_01695 [candidate division WOR-1 bacterium RIFOXYA12_FULL_43_27]OGC19562.1 MAG: hypothetical protein A2292_02635 [candidate division WOR-1 bacterium RIFOXYB2_FULL_46_45]OGC30550.1 MAG: hypothetical protein A2232_02635 [candidate division WOR-1 bacterium RIFOXYA2_FULL_46_56]OGC40617.1 MAG: hypothetical protein A2438_06350 [candidate division WOR-1 bacterium RIFOXYC2_FULL_46_14]